MLTVFFVYEDKKETGSGKCPLSQGMEECFIDEHEYELKEGDAIVISAGAEDKVINTGKSVLRLSY